MSERASRLVSSKIAPARFLVFIAVLIACAVAGLFVFGSACWRHVLLGAFDIAALAFLISSIALLRHGNARAMRRHAAENDANRMILLGLTVLVVGVIFVTIASLPQPSGGPSTAGIVVVIATLAAAWTFTNTVFAFHYAHIYYLAGEGGDRAGLDFPNAKEPDYWDFLYFSFTLGMTFQTSDVAVTGRHTRRIVLLHSVAAFAFNIGILAFVINTLGSATGA